MKHKFDHGTIYHGCCLELMKDIPDGSVDMVLADLPYGNVECHWDNVISFKALWNEYKRILKQYRSVLLTGTQPFVTDMINSNREWFKYDLIWDKKNPGDIFNAKLRPLRQHEIVCVFSEGKTANGSRRNMLYHPVGIAAPRRQPRGNNKRGRPWGGDRPGMKETYTYQASNCPRSIVSFMKSNCVGGHPAQKPSLLFERLIEMYTNEGDIVLDNVIGSGTTAIAAYNTGRRFIGMEKDEKIYEAAVERIKNETAQLKMFAA